ncbi:hypothetical protein KEM55_006470 [Ascosphaera atra]|nr:hypothetical protein KEM55_006470 [Ascosphaera atra]
MATIISNPAILEPVPIKGDSAASLSMKPAMTPPQHTASNERSRVLSFPALSLDTQEFIRVMEERCLTPKSAGRYYQGGYHPPPPPPTPIDCLED